MQGLLLKINHARALLHMFEQDVLIPSISLFRDHAFARIETEQGPDGTVYVITFRDESVGRFTTKYWVED